MRFLELSVLAAVANTAFSSPVDLEKRQQSCTNGAVVFVVRGSDPNHHDLSNNPNPLPNGPMKDIGNAIVAKAGSGYVSGIQYPAINPADGYRESVNKGIYALQGAIYDYMDACRNGQIYILGYSQGAQVTSGALGGSVVAGPVDDRGRIRGAALFADPTFNDFNGPITQGSGANNGRNGVAAGDGSKYRYLHDNFQPRLRSYCQANDNVCDSGSSTQVHLDSPGHFHDVAQNFLLNRV